MTVNEFMRRRLNWGDAAHKYLFEYRPALRSVLAETLRYGDCTSGEPQELINQSVTEGDQKLLQNFYLYPLRSADKRARCRAADRRRD